MAAEKAEQTDGIDHSESVSAVVDASSASSSSKAKSKKKAKKVCMPSHLCMPTSSLATSTEYRCGWPDPCMDRLQTKKPFLLLPTLEAVQQKLPWQLAFSQRLGRHAIASQDIAAGQCVLAEDAVCAVPIQGSDQHTCHQCLSPLPEGSEEYLQSQGILLDKASKNHKRYCSQKCQDADTTLSITGPVHAKISQMGSDTKCDPTLLRFILELDARSQHESSAQSSAADTAHDSHAPQHDDVKSSGGTDHAPNDSLDIITCTMADVSALLSPWDRNQKEWREALTEGMSCWLSIWRAASSSAPLCHVRSCGPVNFFDDRHICTVWMC